jgi:hypothetical protein
VLKHFKPFLGRRQVGLADVEAEHLYSFAASLGRERGKLADR